jgi:predicted acyltransferase
MQLTFRRQAAVVALIPIGHWALFVMFPGTEEPFFSKTSNIGAVLDHFVFGRDNPGYWVSINFITSTATTLFGVWL